MYNWIGIDAFENILKQLDKIGYIFIQLDRFGHILKFDIIGYIWICLGIFRDNWIGLDTFEYIWKHIFSSN